VFKSNNDNNVWCTFVEVENGYDIKWIYVPKDGSTEITEDIVNLQNSFGEFLKELHNEGLLAPYRFRILFK